ncbi:MAG: uracil-DNA glycosylase [Pseudomonadota bacterium]
MAVAPAEAPKDCALCPRLVDYRQDVAAREPTWFNGAVPSFGSDGAELLVVGLAPGVTGANRTGRPFTGDFAGGLLYQTLAAHGFANDKFAADPKDGLELHRTMVTNAVRCVPPQNKPIGAEINTCRAFLTARIAALPNLRAIVCLGRISHDSLLRALGVRLKDAPFGHGAEHQVGNVRVFDSYHCSRYNTNTNRLTPQMFNDVFARVATHLSP